MTRCVHVDVDGTPHVVDWQHAEVARRLGGAVTFVGGTRDLDVVVVGLADGAGHLPANPFATRHPELFFAPAHGPLVLVSSDADGEETDLVGWA